MWKTFFKILLIGFIVLHVTAQRDIKTINGGSLVAWDRLEKAKKHTSTNRKSRNDEEINSKEYYQDYDSSKGINFRSPYDELIDEENLRPRPRKRRPPQYPTTSVIENDAKLLRDTTSLKYLLKMKEQEGSSVSEILQRNNLTLNDLLNGKMDALNSLKSKPKYEEDEMMEFSDFGDFEKNNREAESTLSIEHILTSTSTENNNNNNNNNNQFVDYEYQNDEPRTNNHESYREILSKIDPDTQSEIIELLDYVGSETLKNLLKSKNMSIEEYIYLRLRGSSNLHLAELSKSSTSTVENVQIQTGYVEEITTKLYKNNEFEDVDNRRTLSRVRPSIMASGVILGVTVFVFLTIFITCRIRRKEKYTYRNKFSKAVFQGPVLTARKLSNSSSLSTVMVNVIATSTTRRVDRRDDDEYDPRSDIENDSLDANDSWETIPDYMK